MRFEVAPLPLDVVVCFFLWTGIVPSLWEFVWNVSRNGICLYYYLVYPSLGRLYFTHNSGWHHYYLLWASKYHPEYFGIYWGHPSTFFEFFLFYKLFGINAQVFIAFGIFLRACSAFLGYLFLAKLTKSKLID